MRLSLFHFSSFPLFCTSEVSSQEMDSFLFLSFLGFFSFCCFLQDNNDLGRKLTVDLCSETLKFTVATSRPLLQLLY